MLPLGRCVEEKSNAFSGAQLGSLGLYLSINVWILNIALVASISVVGCAVSIRHTKKIIKFIQEEIFTHTFLTKYNLIIKLKLS